MRIGAIIILVGFLAGCETPRPGPHEGDALKDSMFQLEEQCKAQPELDWCRPHEN